MGQINPSRPPDNFEFSYIITELCAAGFRVCGCVCPSCDSQWRASNGLNACVRHHVGIHIQHNVARVKQRRRIE